MSGRRSHPRFAVLRSPDGVLRVMRDVVVHRVGEGEIVAVSREPGVLGEAVTIEFPVDEASPGRKARVIDSQPVLMKGSVRHRLRLQETDARSSRVVDANGKSRGPARL